MKRHRADVLLASFEDRETAFECLQREAKKLVQWKVTSQYRVFMEKTAPHLPDSPWGVWLRMVGGKS